MPHAPGWRRWTSDSLPIVAAAPFAATSCHSVRFHPATLLFAWGSFVMFLQPLGLVPLAVVAAIILPLCLNFARWRTLVLVRRARWLLLSIAVLFVLATPGQRLPGIGGELGLTEDGLVLGGEHLLRLVLLLASLALVHEYLGTSRMMAGLYWLLAPIAGWRAMRERIVVRLMLVLDHVENSPARNWRDWLLLDAPGPDRLALAVTATRPADWIVMLLVFAAALAFGGAT